MKKDALFTVLFLLSTINVCGASEVKFAVITDVHIGFHNGDRYDDFITAITAINDENVDFSVHLGDAALGPKVSDINFFDDFNNAWDELNAPRYCVVGNHDVKSTFDTFNSKIPNSGTLIVGDPCYGERYYSFDCNGFHFIALGTIGDSNVAGDYNDGISCSAASRYYVPQDQLDWLEIDLSANSDVPIVVFAHIPFYNDEQDYYHLMNASDVRARLHAVNNVVAVFFGHVHGGGESTVVTESSVEIPYYNIPAFVLGYNSYAIVTMRSKPDRGGWANIRIENHGSYTRRIKPRNKNH